MITSIPTQKKLAVYVQNKLNSLIKDHEQYVKTSYYLHKEYKPEEYAEMINKLELCMVSPPLDKITLSDDMFKVENEEDLDHKIKLEEDLRESYINNCERQIQLIKQDMKKANDFHLFITKRKKEMEHYPKSNNELIIQLREYITKTINYYHKDLVDSYFEMFVNKIKSICPDDKDYSKTIGSVYRSKNSKKAMDIILNFFDKMKMTLIAMSMNVKNCKSEEFYKMFVILKSEFKKLIERMHFIIYNFIEQQISYIDDEEEMTDSKIVKMYSETCMSQLNQALITELPALLDEEFKVTVEDRTENLSYVWKHQIGFDFVNNKALPNNNEKVTSEVHEENRNIKVIEINNKPLIAEVVEIKNKPTVMLTIEAFIDTLPNDPINVNELTKMYNNYMGTNYKLVDGRIKGINQHFTKSRHNVNGIKMTFYQKI